jgi:seryl-tRNA synthetase
MTKIDERVTREKQLAEQALLAGLVEHGLFIPTGVPGLYGHGAAYEAVIQGFNDYVSEHTRADAATHVHFPPVMPRPNLERIGYLESFPHLAGLIFSFDGTEADHLKLLTALKDGQSYAGAVNMTDVVMTSATCQPLYPSLRGRLPEQGRLFDLTSYCFRREPSGDPARLQSFRMREQVRLGAPEDVQQWREHWYERAIKLLANIGLEAQHVVANDPFFGRGGRMLAANQLQHQLKFELVIPITSEVLPTAIVSFNYHEVHFTELYGIETPAGTFAHSGCFGLGLERIAVALFKRHGFDVRTWPAPVRSALRLETLERLEQTTVRS